MSGVGAFSPFSAQSHLNHRLVLFFPGKCQMNILDVEGNMVCVKTTQPSCRSGKAVVDSILTDRYESIPKKTLFTTTGSKLDSCRGPQFGKSLVLITYTGVTLFKPRTSQLLKASWAESQCCLQHLIYLQKIFKQKLHYNQL